MHRIRDQGHRAGDNAADQLRKKHRRRDGKRRDECAQWGAFMVVIVTVCVTVAVCVTVTVCVTVAHTTQPIPTPGLLTIY
ncbi:hypothetical protein GCM10009537_00240 [Corynebacterium riegelii]